MLLTFARSRRANDMRRRSACGLGNVEESEAHFHCRFGSAECLLLSGAHHHQNTPLIEIRSKPFDSQAPIASSLSATLQNNLNNKKRMASKWERFENLGKSRKASGKARIF